MVLNGGYQLEYFLILFKFYFSVIIYILNGQRYPHLEFTIAFLLGRKSYPYILLKNFEESMNKCYIWLKFSIQKS